MKRHRWSGVKYPLAVAIAGTLLGGIAPSTTSSTPPPLRPPEITQAQPDVSLLADIQRCIQKAVAQAAQKQPRAVANLQQISTQCTFSVVMLNPDGSVRPDASDRMTALLQATGIKVPRPQATGEAIVPLQLQPQVSLFTVPVVLNGVPLQFILDTGASNTIVDRSVAQQLKLQGASVPSEFLGYLAVGQPTAASQINIYPLASLQVGKAKVTQLNGIGLSTSGLPLKSAGILGLDFLSRFDILLNPATRQLQLRPATQPVLSDIQLQGKFGIMVIPNVFIQGKGPFRFLVDTGAAITSLSVDLAQRLDLKVSKETIRVAGLNGETLAHRARLAGLNLSSRPIAPLSAMVLNSKVFQTLGVDGVLGQDILNRYVQHWRFGPPGALGNPDTGSLRLTPLPQ
ncbi:MAG TPA: retroviral-like aspartic protease family protein [Stenomitos sp.]